MFNRTDRVKALDFHPTEPWILASLYNGTTYMWNYETQAVVASFEASTLPIRAAKFIARKSLIVTGSDDLQIRAFNYNTHDKVVSFEAHQDYIRGIAVHPTQPFILTCSDDRLIKLWDWEQNWRNVMVFEGHSHFVMQINFNPKDSNVFASASLDKTIKVWSLTSHVANYTLEGHEGSVNCVDYYPGSDKPYLISGADDDTVKIWDYQNKSCVQTLQGHSSNISSAFFHPELPLIVSASEDGTVKLWHANTYRLENTLNYGLERAWATAASKLSNDIAIGYDNGIIVLKLGKDEPTVSMDSSGKIIWAKQNEIFTANIKTIDEDLNLKDGDRIMLSAKDLGSSEVFPQFLQHSPNGRFVVVCGDGEYIIYTALAWRNKSFGPALDFCWAADSNEYAVRESPTSVRLFKNFKENNTLISVPFQADGIFGGNLLAVKGQECITFYDWETGACVRRIDVVARGVYWSESDMVAITTDSETYVLKFNRDAFNAALSKFGPQNIDADGIEEAIELIAQNDDSVKTGSWVGDCFIYTTEARRLNFMVGTHTSALAYFDKVLYLLGYIAKDNRVYLVDKECKVYSYALPQSLLDYQTAILRGDHIYAQSILPSIPEDHRNRVAKFLEEQGLKELALEVSNDREQKFDLAVSLGRLEEAKVIADELNSEEIYKNLADAALQNWKFALAADSLEKAKDLEGLLMLNQASANPEGMKTLGKLAQEEGKINISFIANFLSGNLAECKAVLEQSERIPEAAFFDRSYL